MIAATEGLLHSETLKAPLQGVNPRLLASGLPSSAANAAGVSVVGVVPDEEQRISLVAQRIVAREYLRDSSPFGVVIGAELARKFEVQVGSNESAANRLVRRCSVCHGNSDVSLSNAQGGTDRAAQCAEGAVTSSMVGWAVELKDGQKTYRAGSHEVRALRAINLRIAPAEFLAIAGPSGSGKTMLLNISEGLPPWKPANRLEHQPIAGQP